MSKRFSMVSMALLLCLSLPAWSFAESSVPEKKQTVLGLYVTAKQAHEKWRANPDAVKLLDVRTPGEYIFVGHAPMAHNIPSKFLEHQWDVGAKKPNLKDNPDFVSEVKRKFKPADTLLVMCRSGGRGAAAVNRLAAAGYKNVYNIIDGFEGDAIKDPQSYFTGKRLKNGWKNSGAPWTYKLDPELMYLPRMGGG